MKKFLSLSVAAALAIGFAACSSEDDLVSQNQGSSLKGSGTYVQFVIDTDAAQSAFSRAYDNDNLETTGEYVKGTEDECDVNVVYAYITDKSGNLIQMGKDNSGKATYYLEFNALHPAVNNTADVTETTGKASQWYTNIKELPSTIKLGTEYNVYLLCNKAPEGTYTEISKVLASHEAVAASSETNAKSNAAKSAKEMLNGGIPMAARSIDGQIYKTFTPTKDNTESNPAVLSFEVERAWARINFTAGKDTQGALTEIPLYKTVTDATAQTSTAQIGTLEVAAYYLMNVNKDYYTYRHAGAIDENFNVTEYTTDFTVNSLTMPGQYGPISASDAARNFIIDPNSSIKKTSGVASCFWNSLSSIKKNIAWNKTTGDWAEYVTENTMQTAAQKKGQATGIMFKMKIVPTSVVGTWTSGQDLYYLDGIFYASIADINTALGGSALSDSNFRSYGVKKYTHGYAYYAAYVRHYNNNIYTNMANMEFATVRNNTYELSITAAAMNGYETYIPSDDTPNDKDPDGVDPEKPEDTDYPGDPDDTNGPDGPDDEEDVETNSAYLKVNVYVRPWIIRKNDVILGQ